MSYDENFSVGRMVYVPSHIFGTGYYEVKEYVVLSKDKETARLQHNKTYCIPGGPEQPGTGEVIEISKDRFAYFAKPLTEKFSESIALIDFVCANA
ncbi:MAG: hypothetical protein Q7T36_00190 [Fluviicoccus sp.]|uniref:hypothetical protein n=1 Tax=Fluviicoccus sp. TaxID=2003552 RepID=UPI002719F2D8|nr:hypothetical protein [Fluviicoccus sp.]MDO8328875.1 hypothetical protein [Fluviicoccus sp.]